MEPTKEDIRNAVKNAIREQVSENAVKNESDEKYNKVFNAVAAHMDLDPEKVDDAEEDTQKKFYDTVDQCWDSNENKVPDSCPVDIHHLNDE